MTWPRTAYVILIAGSFLMGCAGAEHQLPEITANITDESQKNELSSKAANDVCQLALEADYSSKYETPRWENHSAFRKYVDEAKRRGFSAHRCADLLGWKRAQANQVRSKVGDTKGPPPTFAPDVQELFEKYMAEQNPLLFVVSTDGQAAYYTYCPEQYDHCIETIGATKSKAFTECERDSGGVPCKTYAMGRRIVWKGTPAPTSQTPKATQTRDEATSPVAQDAREKIYDQIMASLSGETVTESTSDAELGQKFAYRSYEKNKTLAVCIDWNRSSPNNIRHLGWWVIERHSKSRSKRVAMEDCQSRYEKRGCKCQVVDQNDENVLEVPQHFLVHYSSKTEPSSLPKRSLSSQATADICNVALSFDFASKHEKPRWKNQAGFRGYVAEAERRGLTPQSCADLLGWKAAESLKVLPSAEDTEKPAVEKGNIEERLTKLKSLYDRGLITQQEYENKQREILEGL